MSPFCPWPSEALRETYGYPFTVISPCILSSIVGVYVEEFCIVSTDYNWPVRRVGLIIIPSKEPVRSCLTCRGRRQFKTFCDGIFDQFNVKVYKTCLLVLCVLHCQSVNALHQWSSESVWFSMEPVWLVKVYFLVAKVKYKFLKWPFIYTQNIDMHLWKIKCYYSLF